ncbi:MAG: PilT protein domain protein [Acidobacteria bacterium]|nr:PilT protein domain protein [Acidobacteriota bacterium]
MQRVVVDANVFLSFMVHRNDKQRDAAKALLAKAEDGELVAILPQFVVFEIVYVLQSAYSIRDEELAKLTRDLLALPGVQITDESPWRRVFDVWPRPLPSLADASIVAVAMANRYEAVATFDRKLANRLESFGLAAYF